MGELHIPFWTPLTFYDTSETLTIHFGADHFGAQSEITTHPPKAGTYKAVIVSDGKVIQWVEGTEVTLAPNIPKWEGAQGQLVERLFAAIPKSYKREQHIHEDVPVQTKASVIASFNDSRKNKREIIDWYERALVGVRTKEA